jgi:chitodextrinase
MSARVLPATVALVALALAAAAAPAAAADRSAPTKPGNFRVTAKTQTTVSLAWNASTDNSGSVRYDVRMWQEGRYVTVATLPQTQTTYTKTGLIPNVQYFFHVEAVDPSGNRSFSDGAFTTTDRDRTAPSTPTDLRVTRVTASQIDLAWTASSDDTGIRSYLVAVSPHDGNLAFTGPTSATIVGLAPETTYTFTVKAQDLGYNFSPVSAPASATTAASTDVTPPSAPTNLFVSDQSCGEVRLTWTQSTDDQDPQSAIRYRIFINGAPDPLGQTPIGVGRWITYGVVDGSNTFVLRAVDSAGNVSAPSNPFTLVLDDCM